MKIVIVGGGTAGWLSALYCLQGNSLVKNEVVVIESSKIPIIGAGEGSTGILVDTLLNKLKFLNITETDFLYNTEATLKLGIRFKDWNGVGTEYLSPIQPTDTTMSRVDVDFLAYLAKEKYHNSTAAGYLMENGLSTYSVNKKDTTGAHSYHFDAHKVGQYLKSLAIKRGVTCLDTEIESLNRNAFSGELESVNTTIGNITGDFWIDCSGMARVLIKPMGGGWKSYSDYLPMNNALPYIHNYEVGEAPRLETLAWAQRNGWMWQIPTQERYGCGYVYCDYFTNVDNALVELEETTGRKIEPLRHLKFDVGRVENFWKNNVVAIGLSSGFLEPLQATSIHSTIIQLDLLVSATYNFGIDRKLISTESNISNYNNFIKTMWDDFRDLLQIHYMTNRDDSDFWKFCKHSLKKTDKTIEVLDVCKVRVPSILDFGMYHGSAHWGVWCWTLAGLDLITKETANDMIKSYSIEGFVNNKFSRIQTLNKLNSIKMLSNKDFMRALKERKLGK